MGWLRDLMGAMDPKLRSYGELARQCLDHPAWPRDIQPQARSLASLFSKFDRSIELEWLDDRPEVQVVLAHVLQLPALALENEVRKRAQRDNPQPSRYRLPDAPSARPLDLKSEPLPPGFPEQLKQPASWGRQWWQVGRGGGASLVGHWLQARGLAEHALCTDVEELEALLRKEAAPLFVELAFTVRPELVHKWAIKRAFCIAGLGPAPVEFEAIEAPPADPLVGAWLDWLLPLLPQHGHFDREKILAWLTPLWSGDLPCSFEAVVSLAVFADEQGETAFECKSPKALVHAFTQRALQRAHAAGAPEADWLQVHCLDVLCGMARRAVLETDTAWEAPRSHAAWLQLVPTEYHRGVDAEWTRLSLQQAGSPLTVAELEKALQAMPPGAFRVVSALVSARLLREDGHGLRFGPEWLSSLVKHWGRASLLESAPFEWGEIALRATHLRWLLDTLHTRLDSGDTDILDAALEIDDDDSPGFVMAVEMLVMAAGRALLLEQELEPDQIAALWSLQMTFAIHEQSSGWGPRLLTSKDNLPIFGQWLAAMWALSEQLESGKSGSESDLHPWTLPTCDTQHLDAIAAALAAQQTCTPYVSSVYAMLGRLLQHFERESAVTDGGAAVTGPERQIVLRHPLFAVARVLRGDGWNAWQLAQAAPFGVESARSLVTAEAWPYLAKTVWRSWVTEGMPAGGERLFDGSGDWAMMFWPHLPDHVLRQLLDARSPVVLTVPDVAMKDEWITMYLERVPQEPAQAVRYLKAIPIHRVSDEHCEVLFELLETHGLNDLIETVWNAHPTRALAHVRRHLDQGKSQARLWLQCVPQEWREQLLEHMEDATATEGSHYPSLRLCRDWLHSLCVSRVPGWPACYELLSEMELRLKRANRAR